MNLNVIGNGFDMYHGLPSSYYYFGCYLINDNPSFYERMSDYFGFKFGINLRAYPDYEYDYAVHDVFWSEFETHLGNIEEYAIINTHNYDLGLEIDEYDIPMDEDEFAEDIKKAFVHWIKDSVDTEENYKIIKAYVNKKTKKDTYNHGFSKKDKFLVFNYTHVLQSIYKIDSDAIEYVHGECTGSEDDELIIGHGNDNRIDELSEKIEEFDSRALYQRERTEQLEYKCLLRFIRRLRKDVEFCMWKCKFFYTSFYEEPEYINLYGLSLGEVDIPYLLQIRKKWPNSKWRFSYYSDRDKVRVHEVAINYLKLKIDEFITFKFANADSLKILKKIIDAQGIEDVPIIKE